MAVYWVRADSNNALDAMAAVERALQGDPSALATPPGSEPSSSDGDGYLRGNLALAQRTWSTDPHQIVVSQRPYVAWAINRFQRAVRKATWWYLLPQWLQLNEFHGAVVRVLEVLAAQQRQLFERVSAIESAQRAQQIQLLEQQIQILRGEQDRLQRRILELETQLSSQDQAAEQDVDRR